ncbi:hypothetical protein [Nocardia mangyaensis]|uniref:hypothetical protein n=1 Tax=Nocardia mangyaensis TaxID=2213200 RepID=UPI001F0ABCEE|nr:hypothetical protein [Nocardia mangyaensis]
MLVPLSVASLVTGVVQSLGTPWGLIGHYWVLFELVLNVVATAILLLYTGTVDHYAALAADPASTLDALRAPTFVVHGVAATVILVGATVLAVVKPRGLTLFGGAQATGTPRPRPRHGSRRRTTDRSGVSRFPRHVV